MNLKESLIQLRQELSARRADLQTQIDSVNLVIQLLSHTEEKKKSVLHWTRNPKNRKKMMATIKRMQEAKK